jgi:DNA polymerase-3 subunit delta
MMIVTLTGSNDFGRLSALRQLADDFVQAHGDLALERIDGEDAEFARLQEALTSLPFLAGKKLVILDHPSANKRFTEQSDKLFAGLPETTDLVIHEPRLDKRSSYYKYLKKQTDYREFADMDPARLSQWLSEQVKRRGGSLSRADAQYLIERIGPSQQLLATDLDKLLLYDPAISRQTIDLLTEATPQSTVFQLLEAAFGGDTARMLTLYEEQRTLKVEPQQVIAMLAWLVHLLAII